VALNVAENDDLAPVGSCFEDPGELRKIISRLERFFQWEGFRDATELADETLCRVFTRIAAGAQVPHEKLPAFFFGVARNVALEARERQQRWAGAENVEQPAITRDLDNEIWIAECLAKLPAEDRAILLANVWKSTRELAGELGISEVHVRVRLHNARKRLREVVKRDRAVGNTINGPPVSRHFRKGA
jgi:RNA polymerase sigma factor (sigma-70 family)